ncbi:uncharacterized protein EI90DRAFT_1105358 [Cantharellus anzutake]|uniref:uncharacterized protein n=1 Tax=Cantharellus anzutake TaxID=1750568 RepID=UPI0019033D46|nr:uncharacterized protein EI90DRAFT_1105358 [Cantharellus anzutake]KAF8330864.1 hypothetical protein EI90DRAFT_1105358 [Cantharellus anzutake]
MRKHLGGKGANDGASSGASSTSVKPVVALVGSTGYLGKSIVPVFAKAANEGQFAAFKILTSSTPKDELKSAASDKVTIVQVDYASPASLESALEGVDVLVSALGASKSTEAAQKSLVQAAVASKVKVYFPSEWGTDLDVSPYPFPPLDAKTEHVEEARKAGLKTVVFVVGVFSDIILLPISGWFTAPNTVHIPDSGKNKAVFTAKKHIVQYALQAVILAAQDPAKFPDKVRVWDDNRSWDEYTAELEQVLGRELIKNVIPKEQLVQDFAAGPSIGGLGRLLAADGLTDYSDNHNELLNPGEKYFKRQTVGETLKEVGFKL